MAGKVKHCYFSTSKQYSNGTTPSVAANSQGKLVCVLNSTLSNTVYHVVGAIGESEVTWGASQFVCNGSYPKVAINDDNQVVVVYAVGVFSSINYRTGKLQRNGQIDWEKKEYGICRGKNASVAMNGKKVVVVFEDGCNTKYCFGIIDESRDIKWHKKEAQLQLDASYPSVAINDRLAVVIFNQSYNLVTKVREIGDYDITWSEIPRIQNRNPKCSNYERWQ